MMSKKWTFSLTSLITIIALAFIVSPAMAADGGPTVTISTADHLFDGDDNKDKQVVPANMTPKAPDGNAGTEVENAYAVTFKFSDPVAYNETISAASNATPDAFEPLVDVMWVFTDKDGKKKSGTQPTINDNSWEQKSSTEYTAVFTGLAAEDRVVVYVPADVATAISGKTQGKGNQRSSSYTFQIIAADKGSPKPVTMTRLTPESAFSSTKVSGAFDVKIVLSEKPKEFTKAMIGIQNGTIGKVVDGGAVGALNYIRDDVDGVQGTYDITTAPTDSTGLNATTFSPRPTGNNDDFYQYKVTITPDRKKDKVIVWVKEFDDRALAANKYEEDRTSDGVTRKVPGDLAANKEKVEVSVDITGVPKDTAKPGSTVPIPNDLIIPTGGYLVIASDDGDGTNDAEKSSSTGIVHPGDPKDDKLAVSGRSARAQLYNVAVVGLRDLENFLINDGTIDLITDAGGGAAISEIMWGTDASLADPKHNQWIEIRNLSGADIKTSGAKLMFYEANEELPDYDDADNKIADRLSTRNWNIVGMGQSGRSSSTIGTGDDVEFVSTSDIVSMQRIFETSATGAIGRTHGWLPAAWAPSQRPSVNFRTDTQGRVGSPGAAPINYPEPKKEPTKPDPPAPAMASDIMITEIMVDTGNGRLPQWIELTNVSGEEKSLEGWSVEITNSADDADVVGTSLSINLSGTLGVGGGPDRGGDLGKTLLLVAWGGRSSKNLEGSDRVINVSGQLKQTGRYTLLSPMEFEIMLLPPQNTGIVQKGDKAGNLDAAEAWEIEMSDDGRSSLIRDVDAGVDMGKDVDGWVLASSTSLLQTPATWYGSDEDAGTPGVVGGGPLPVELSHFRPARDKATGAVVITWATQSELNNAGFFIKRSQQRNGEFKVINATMIAGAGTTSEKQFYTYTDTTAQPNVVYYYQIEDVSLDGNRQTLTRGIRLKGHIGAAGKLTSTWGELKSSNE